MKKSLAVFRRDLKRILRNPIALVVTLGICIVPCLYAWINIIGNWDPYANTSGISVAVVNEDKPAEVEGVGDVCVGDLLVDSLKENDAIGWEFIDDKDTAIEGVKSGKHYAAIVIAQDFTSSLTDVLQGDHNKGHITYYVNEKLNAIAPKVTDTGASTIETQINGQFMAVVSEVAIEKLQGAFYTVLDKSGDAVSNVSAKLNDVGTTIHDINDQLGGLNESLGTASSSISNAATALKDLEGMGTGTADSLADSLSGLDGVRTSSNNAITDLNNALATGAQHASSLSSTASHDISSIAGNIAFSQSQLNSAIATLERDLTDAESLRNKVTSTREYVISITPTDDRLVSLRLELDNQLGNELDVLVQISDEAAGKLDELRIIASQLEGESSNISSLSSTLNDKISGVSTSLIDGQSSLTSDTLTSINNTLDKFATLAARLETALRMADTIVSQTISVSFQVADSLNATKDSIEQSRLGLTGLEDDVHGLADELSAIQSSQAWSTLKRMLAIDSQSVHDFMESPVRLVKKRLFPVENYGSGVAPFFTSLALWVGGIALIAIFKLEVDSEEVGDLRPWQAYFGRWFLFVSLGILQAIICCTGNLIIGIQCAHPWALYLSAIVASFAFINLIFALSVAFKHIGKALAFTLIILQVPGSAGMYPIEMMPSFFQKIYPFLPFTYSNNAMREAIGGMYGTNLAKDLGMLLAFVIPAILIGVTARTHLINVNALFDRRLRETDHLLVSEPTPIKERRFRLATVVKAIYTPDEYREALETRGAAFERRYPSLIRFGIMALFIVPLALFLLMLVHDAKLQLLACWIVAIITIYVVLIVIEYLHDHLEKKRELTQLSREEKDEVLYDVLRDEPMPYAPIDKLIELRNRRKKGGDAQ